MNRPGGNRKRRVYTICSMCIQFSGKNEAHMKKEYNFFKGKRGAVTAQAGKTRITIYLDDAILIRFKSESAKTGKGYQTLINDAT